MNRTRPYILRCDGAIHALKKIKNKFDHGGYLTGADIMIDVYDELSKIRARRMRYIKMERKIK